MKNIERLPEAAERGLAGLNAGANLKYRIIHEAAKKEEAPARPRRAWVPALCCALVLVLCGVFIPSAVSRRQSNLLIVSQPAGEATDAPVLSAQNSGIAGGNLATGVSVPSYTSIWETSQSGTFPLIGLNGAYYRMLTAPSSVSDSQLGASLGTVAEYTTEPALSDSNIILSNCSESGTKVYEISGMIGTLVAAKVSGVTRLFQRVSFNGTALKSGETLSDTLQIAGHVTAMELSDVGTITDGDTIASLLTTLFSSASYKSSGSVSGSQSLLFTLDNGFTVQLAVKDDRFSACGTWDCPEFFEAFAAAVQ
ncbi:MAG: hypothetical protein Q4B32_00375 [Clostridia bacterium]|nr:hypothetical protein [Clostridia bacterium]